MLKHLEALCNLCGTSGAEQPVRDYIRAQIGDRAECGVDPLGNLIVFGKGEKRPKNKVMLAAHMDEVGMIVTAIRSDGSLRIGTVGGVDAAVMLGRQVLVGDGQIPGVIGAKAVHKLTEAERDQAPTADALSVDIGALTREEAQVVVSLGDVVHFQPEFSRFGDGMLRSKALDDRIGCAILLDLMEQPLLYDTWFVFNVQEEVGLRGAQASAFTVAPDIALVLETTTAADLPEVSGADRVCTLGGGAVVSFMDRSTLYDRALYQLANRVAAAKEIPVQTKTRIAGGNDSGAIHISGAGVRTLAISAPCRYLHSPSCVAKESDVRACEELALHLLQEAWNL